jgi:pimeloyl-ACP methyl ester carboxylesterase
MNRHVRLLAVIATSAILAGLAAAGAADAACPERAECGSVPVPLDRAHPAAGKIDIAYALVPHSDTSSPSLGTVVTNPGGPGQSTIGSASLYLQGAPQLFVHRDLLLVDPRGTGDSGALTCPGLRRRHPIYDQTIATICGAALGARAGRYGSADVADDIDAVRAALGIGKVDLWGDSYGTFLMQVYAARHPRHIRSVVLDGAFPIDSDPWGRDVLRGTRRVLRVACARTLHCSGRRILSQIAVLAKRLRHHPIKFTAAAALGGMHVTIREGDLAELTYAQGHPEDLKPLPRAVAAAVHGRLGRLKELVTELRVEARGDFTLDPRLVSWGTAFAAACHDYPRPYDLAASPAVRHAQYRQRLRALDRSQFFPFSPAAWLSTRIDAGPKCLDWPTDARARSGVRGLRMPDVPTLVMSGDLDSNTPIEQGRVVARQFPHASFAIVANAGHTPALDPCGVGLGIDFVEHLTVNPNRCRRARSSPTQAR